MNAQTLGIAGDRLITEALLFPDEIEQRRPEEVNDAHFLAVLIAETRDQFEQGAI